MPSMPASLQSPASLACLDPSPGAQHLEHLEAFLRLSTTDGIEGLLGVGLVRSERILSKEYHKVKNRLIIYNTLKPSGIIYILNISTEVICSKRRLNSPGLGAQGLTPGAFAFGPGEE